MKGSWAAGAWPNLELESVLRIFLITRVEISLKGLVLLHFIMEKLVRYLPFERWRLAVKGFTNVEHCVILNVFQYTQVFIVTTAWSKSKALKLH